MFQGPPCLASIYLQLPGCSDRSKADVLALALYKAGGMVDDWASLPLPVYQYDTRWKFNSSPLKIYHPKRKVVFQPPFFRGYVKLRGVFKKG